MLFAPPGRLLSRANGPAIAMIHGALCSPAFWLGPLPRHLVYGRTVAYPLPGHYPWRLPTNHLLRLLRARELADAYAVALRRDFQGRPVHLVGHSTGALISIAIASRFPHLVERLTIIGGFTNGHVAGGSPYVRQFLTNDDYPTLPLKMAVQLWCANRTTFSLGLASVVGPRPVDWHTKSMSRALEQMRHDLLRSDMDQLIEVGRWVMSQNLTPALRDVRMPTLVVSGADDPVVPITHQRDLYRHLPRGHFVELPRTGHLPMFEQPQALGAIMTQRAA